jgi:hypothetical protein
MALVSAGFEASVVLVDTGGNKATRTFELTAATNAEALTDMATIVGLYQALTNAVVESYRVAEKFIEDAFNYPIGNVNVEELASVVVGVTDKPDDPHTIKIPAPKDLLFVAATGKSRNTVDVTVAALLAFMATYNPGSNATFSDGDTWDGLIHSGKRIHRGSRLG